jgi:hypothetical protein
LVPIHTADVVTGLETTLGDAMAQEPPLEYPDARLTVSVKCENGELESGIRQLNPLFQEMVRARSATLGDTAPEARPKDPKNPHFGG